MTCGRLLHLLLDFMHVRDTVGLAHHRSRRVSRSVNKLVVVVVVLLQLLLLLLLLLYAICYYYYYFVLSGKDVFEDEHGDVRRSLLEKDPELQSSGDQQWCG